MPIVAEIVFATLLTVGSVIGLGLMLKMGWKLLRPKRRESLLVTIKQGGSTKSIRMYTEDTINVVMDGVPVATVKSFGGSGLEIFVPNQSKVELPTKNRVVEI